MAEHNYQEDLFERLSKSSCFKNQKLAFSGLFKGALWWMIKKADKASINFKGNWERCDFIKNCKKNRFPCQRSVIACLNLCKRKHRLQKFTCPAQLNGFCLPVVDEDRLYGFIVLCGIREKITDKILFIFTTFIKTIIKEIQKELELSKLYDTIRPKQIALSTTHSVHRLMSTTLELNELLPRIARLILQVLRARWCSILLWEQTKKSLTPKAVVNLRKKGDKHLNRVSWLDKKLAERVIKRGSFLLKPQFLCVPLMAIEPIGVIIVKNKQNGKPLDTFDREILATLAEQIVVAIKNAQLYEEQTRIIWGSIKSLATALNASWRPSCTPTLTNIVSAIAEEMGLEEERIRHLQYASLIHDAGKIGIPEEILSKPSALSGKEYRLIKKHPIKGAEIIRPLEALKPVIPIILYHHERFDGRGYPSKLKGEQIPLEARIMAVADAFEAMIYGRPYRNTISIPQAVEEIKRNSGIQFDPQTVKAFLRLVKEKRIKDLIKKGT